MNKPFLSNYESDDFIPSNLDDDTSCDTESIETSDYDYAIIDMSYIEG